MDKKNFKCVNQGSTIVALDSINKCVYRNNSKLNKYITRSASETKI